VSKKLIKNGGEECVMVPTAQSDKCDIAFQLHLSRGRHLPPQAHLHFPY